MAGGGPERVEEGGAVATLADEEVAGPGKLEGEYVWLSVRIASRLTPMFLSASLSLDFPQGEGPLAPWS